MRNEINFVHYDYKKATTLSWHPWLFLASSFSTAFMLFFIIILVEHTFNLTQQPNIWMKIEVKMDMKVFRALFPQMF